MIGVPILFDKKLDVVTQIRDKSEGSISETTSFTKDAPIRWHKHNCCVVFDVDSYSGYATGVSEWNLSVELLKDEFSSPISIGFAKTTGEGGKYFIPLLRSQMEAVLESGSPYLDDSVLIQASVNKTGTPGSLTFGAFVTNS